MKNLNLKKLHLIFYASLLVSIVNAQCPNPVACSSGSNGDIVSLKLGGVGGVKTVATFGYDAGISFDALGTAPNFIFKTSGTQRMTILGSGNVGIGTASPQAKLDLNGAMYINGKISFYYSGSYYNGITNDGNGNLVFNVGPTAPIMQLTSNSVSIGCSSSGKLNVNGKIQATEVEIKSAPCSDYVFENNYKLMKLSEVEQFVTTHKHLPEVPSAKEFQENGYSVGQMDDLLLRKVEELTLYVIELKKENDALKQAVKSLK